jgi:hypothetical protein
MFYLSHLVRTPSIPFVSVDVQSPGRADRAITVGATDDRDQRWGQR